MVNTKFYSSQESNLNPKGFQTNVWYFILHWSDLVSDKGKLIAPQLKQG